MKLAEIEKEVQSGLPNEKQDLDDARQVLDFYRGDFGRYPSRPPGYSYDVLRYRRHSLFCRRVVGILTANLYKEGPARSIAKDRQATAWLEEVYRHVAIDAVMQQADRFGALGDVAAIQFRGVKGPRSAECPVGVHVWDRSSFCVWFEDDDPLEPEAVATIDFRDNRRHLRLWTADEFSDWETEKLRPGQTAGGTAYRFQGRKPNPYKLLPFSFTHWEYPVSDFFSGSPGANLKEANDYLNFFWTEQGDVLRYSSRPVIRARGVREGWRPPTPIQPGDIWEIPSGMQDETGNDVPGEVDYLQPDTGFIGSALEDLREYVSHTLEMNGVPPGTVRLERPQVNSGIQVVAEQIPLILWAQARQRPFHRYECRAWRTAALVGAAHYRNNRVEEGLAAALEEAGRHGELTLRWPEMVPELPGPERDQADKWGLDNAITSRTRVLMKRFHLTRAEARHQLREIARDRDFEATLFGDPSDPYKALAAGMGPDERAGGGDPESESEATPGDPGLDDGGEEPEAPNEPESGD